MKKLYLVHWVLVVLLLLSSVVYSDDRYVLCAKDVDGNECYLDTQSIAYTNSPDIIRFWVKISFSDAARKHRASNVGNKRQRRIIEQQTETKQCIEINFKENTYRVI